MSLSRILAIARFEGRILRRLVRTWVLFGLAMILAVFTAVQYGVIHRFLAGSAGFFANATRDFYLFQSAQILMLVLAVFGIFLTFDWRHRDVAAHWAPIGDASPATPLELALGKFLAIVRPVVWCFTLLAIAQVIIALAAGIQLAPSSVLFANYAFGLLLVLPTLAVSFGVAGLTGSRALAILLALAYLAGGMATAFLLPEWASVLAGGIAEIPLHSWFVGYDLGSLYVLTRAAQLALVLTCVAVATLGPSFRRSPDPASQRTHRFVALGAALTFLVLELAAFRTYQRPYELRAAVIAAEEAVAALPHPVVVRREIDVTLRPAAGRIEASARLTLRNDTSAALERLVFRLNGGLDVTSAEMGGAPARVERNATVLVLTPAQPLAQGAESTLTIAWAGRISPESIAPEVALEVQEIGAQSRGLHRFLGTVPAFVDRGVVVLGEDAGWFPAPGVESGHAGSARRRRSFATGTLTVRAPEGWKVASVGRRTEEAGVHRFEQGLAVSGLSLNAGPYEEVSADIDGLPVRLLYHRKHAQQLEFLDKAAGAFREWGGKRLRAVKDELGLEYPFPELTFVEVPQTLAAHGGGWEARNRMSAAGVVMFREGGLLGTHFEQPLKSKRRKFEKDAGGGRSPAASKAPPSKAEAPPAEVEAPVPQDEAAAPKDGAATDAAAAPAGPALGEPAVVPEPGAESQPTPAAEGLAEFDEGAGLRDVVLSFLSSDFTGGDLERLAFASFWDARLQAEGPGGAVLERALSSVVAEEALGRSTLDHPAAIELLMRQDVFVQAGLNAAAGQDVTDQLLRALLDMDSVYDLIARQPLAGIDARAVGREYLGVVHVRGRLPLIAIRETLGATGFREALGELLANNTDGHFTWEDVRSVLVAQASADDADEVTLLLDSWLSGTGVPAFTVREAHLQPLAGDEGVSQVTVVIQNRGTALGVVRLAARRGDASARCLAAVPAGESREVGLTLKALEGTYSIEPFFALNRVRLGGKLDVREGTWTGAPFEGPRAAPPLVGIEAVIVDNKDAEFTVGMGADGEAGFLARKPDGKEFRLPAYSATNPFARAGWRRYRGEAEGWRPFGLYDPTAAVTRGRKLAERSASWRAEVVVPGQYLVQAYLPSRGKGGDMLTKRLAPQHHFTVVVAGVETNVEIDTGSIAGGWTDLGRFDVSEGLTVRLSDQGDGFIVADAVRLVKEDS